MRDFESKRSSKFPKATVAGMAATNPAKKRPKKTAMSESTAATITLKTQNRNADPM